VDSRQTPLRGRLVAADEKVVARNARIGHDAKARVLASVRWIDEATLGRPPEALTVPPSSVLHLGHNVAAGIGVEPQQPKVHATPPE
jgi:hypothetical protein